MIGPVRAADPTGPDVLVVDDDEDIRTSLERGLTLSGFAVRTVPDGESALREVASRPPDALVLDVGLPGADGIRVVTLLRARGMSTPVCMLSARTSVDDRVAGLAAGADDYLVKPFALTELVARGSAEPALAAAGPGGRGRGRGRDRGGRGGRHGGRRPPGPARGGHPGPPAHRAERRAGHPHLRRAGRGRRAAGRRPGGPPAG